jgi:hypothetical protein
MRGKEGTDSNRTESKKQQREINIEDKRGKNGERRRLILCLECNSGILEFLL